MARPKGTANHCAKVAFFQPQRRLLREDLIKDLNILLGSDLYSKMCYSDMRFCLGIAFKTVTQKRKP